MNRFVWATAFGAISLLCAPASANLLTNGDFESGSLTSLNEFSINSQFGTWVVLGTQYTRVGSGQGGASDDYARHSVAGDGQDQRLVQFVSGSGIGAGNLLELSFDYIYRSSPNANSNPKLTVSLIGIDNASRNYQMYAGTGPDGQDFGNGEFAVALPDVLLAQTAFDFTSPSAGWATNQLLSATTTRTFAAFGVIVQSGCYVADVANVANCDNLRGVDNFVLNSVPEPATLALLGLGLAGLGVSRRRP